MNMNMILEGWPNKAMFFPFMPWFDVTTRLLETHLLKAMAGCKSC